MQTSFLVGLPNQALNWKYLDVSFVDEDGLAKLCPLAHDFAENDGLFEEKDLQLFELFGWHFAQLRATVKLTVE